MTIDTTGPRLGDWKPVETPFFRDGVATATAVTRRNNIVAFDGQVGTGKTTCARYVADHLDRPSCVVTMPHHPAPLDLLRRAHESLTGIPGTGTRVQLQNAILDRLEDWHGVLIVDELQYSQPNAMQELVYLYEESRHAFALIVVGAGVLQAVSHHPQLLSRIMGQVVFEPLKGRHLVAAVRELDSRFADTAPTVISQHDQAACHGLLRRWALTTEWLDSFAVSGTATNDDLASIRSMLPSMYTQPDTTTVKTRRIR